MSLSHRCAALEAMRAAILIVGIAFALCVNTVAAAQSREIRVVAVHGTVHVTMAGVVTPLSADAILYLPAEIRTGADGAVELRQGATTIAAAANTELLIPESAAEDGLLERVVQISGNAFYNVSKREKSKLRVETPHLVAIVKGTQFNVAAHSDSATIALYEGRLEIQAADGSGIIDLYPGEIAIRRSDEIGVRVLRTNAAAAREGYGSTVASNVAASSESATSAAGTTSIASEGRAATPERADPAADIAQTSIVGTDVTAPMDALVSTSPDGSLLDVNVGDIAGVGKSIGIETGIDTSLVATDFGAALDIGGANISADVGTDSSLVATDLGTSIDIAGGGANLGIDAGIDVGSVGADLGAGVDIGGSGANISVDAGIDTGPVATDLGAGVDIGGSAANISADAGIDAGPISTDLGTAVDVGDSGAQVSVDAAVGAGPALVDAGVNVGTDQLDASVDVGAGTDGVAADVGVQDGGVGVDAQLGDAVDIGVGLGGEDGGLDVDVEIGDNDDENLVDTVEDVLGGLLNRRRRE